MVIKHLTVASEELISKPASLINMLKTEIRQNPFKPNGIWHYYQLDKSVVRWYFSLFKF